MYPEFRQSDYATAVMLLASGHYRVVIDGPSSQAVRTIPAFQMLRQLAERKDFDDLLIIPSRKSSSILFVQYFDVALNNVRSVAFCRDVHSPESISLIPDTYFFFQKGYEHLRALAISNSLPEWDKREERCFWRGSPTVNWDMEKSKMVTEIAAIPRVQLCLRLRDFPRADVGIWGDWHLFSKSAMESFFCDKNIRAPFIPMSHHARFRYLIDIDGVGSAWSFFEKLLLGSTVIKVESRYKQWFYDELVPWVHFVPATADLSDIESKINWCLEHPKDAREIASAGQQIALSWTFERSCAYAVHQMASCLIPLGHSPQIGEKGT